MKLYVRMPTMWTGAGLHSFISIFDVDEENIQTERDFFENIGCKTSLKDPNWSRGKLQEEL